MSAVAAAQIPAIRAVREAVEHVVERSHCAKLIERALARNGLSQLPDDPNELRGWLRTSLVPEVRAAAGEEAVRVLNQQLAPLVDSLDGGARRATGAAKTSRPRRATSQGGTAAPAESLASPAPLHEAIAPPPPDEPIADYLEFCEESERMDQTQPDIPPGPVDVAPSQGEASQPIPLLKEADDELASHERPLELSMEEVPHVRCRLMIASSDSTAVRALQQRLGSALAIEHVEQIVQLMELAPLAQDERVALLLDCRKPTMHPASVAGLADELPYGWWVIAWGIDTLTWEELEPDRQGPLHWVRCAPEASWTDVIGLSSTLLAAGS